MKNLLKFQVKVFVLTAILLTSIAGMLSAKKIAIIDAGSSGSRLYVYDINENGTTINILYPAPEQEAASKWRALSSVAIHSDSVKAFLDTMANKYTPQPNDTIPLYVLATAGMRLVPENKANEIYQKMCSSPTKYFNGFLLHTAMTISGQYEGLYAWIAANYRNETLGSSTATTYGILEIGGASMQIAFATTCQPNQPNNPCISHTWNNTTYTIYSKSYLGGGVDQVFANNTQQQNFGVPLDNAINHENTQLFLGLGKPIEIALDSARGNSAQQFNAYSTNLERERNNIPDTQQNFHPVMNAKYIAYVVDSLKLGGKLSKLAADKKSDWTEGAALDIIINGEKPEKFNYQTKN